MAVAIALSTRTLVSPFGDPASESFLAGENLAETQDRACRAAGLKLERAASPSELVDLAKRHGGGAPVVVFLDRTYVSEKALADFLKRARKEGGPLALALSPNASVDYTRPLQDVRDHEGLVVHDVVWASASALPSPKEDAVEWMHELRDRARPLEVPKREIVVPVQLPTIGEREKTILRFPITSTVVVSVEHWIHVLWLNQLSFGIRWVELIRKHLPWAIWRALTALSLNRHKILDRMVWRDPEVQIHPTAYVSASILGRGVRIGPHATVRNSIVGEGAIIQDHAVLLNCVVGPRSLITENTFLVSTVVYPDATVGNYKLQVSLIGRGAYLNSWASFVDAKFEGSVRVQHKGALVSSERSFLGSCVGHGAKVAAKVLIQPGREIPNGAVIVMRPDEVISVVPGDVVPGRPMVRDRGTLVELGKERPGS